MYLISANGIYRCCKYLCNITFYSDENGWTGESEKIKEFSYKKIKIFLAEKYVGIKTHGIIKYDGNTLWNEFF